jgi:hypothetical protein
MRLGEPQTDDGDRALSPRTLKWQRSGFDRSSEIVVWRMVIGDDGDGHFADGETLLAERLHHSLLMCASLGPNGAAVPGRRIALRPISPGHARQDSR